MYKSFEIKNFRCFEHLKIKDLARVNLIAGKNNVGKTALLEALYLHASLGAPSAVVDVVRCRAAGLTYAEARTAEALWHPLWYRFDTSADIAAMATRGDGGVAELRVSQIAESEDLGAVTGELRVFNAKAKEEIARLERSDILRLDFGGPDGWRSEYLAVYHELLRRLWDRPPHARGVALVPAGSPDDREVMARVKHLTKHKQIPELVDALRVIEPAVSDIRLMERGPELTLGADVDGFDRLIPLDVCGEGVRRLTGIVAAVRSAAALSVMVDEVENGFHYTVLKDVWKVIGEAARRFGTQVFATTHSFECIRAAHEAFSESEEYDFRLHRLQKVDGQIEDFVYDQETLEAGLEMGLEVR